jgi:hypothetical protein
MKAKVNYSIASSDRTRVENVPDERLVEITRYLSTPGHYITNEFASVAKELLGLRHQIKMNANVR